MNVYNESGENVGQIELASEIMETPINRDVLHQVVVMHLANKRSGTASTKGRSEVSGTGRKLFRQKGTGMARAGSRRSPLRVGGGVAFGPKPRGYGYKVPKKLRRMAIKCAIADKFQNDNVLAVDAINIDSPKTKQLIDIMGKFGISRDEKILIVLDAPNENVLYSARNIPRVSVCVWDSLNTYDILWHDRLLVTQKALEKIEDRFFAVETSDEEPPEEEA
jgi:large subunit ribosomal protein L4